MGGPHHSHSLCSRDAVSRPPPQFDSVDAALVNAARAPDDLKGVPFPGQCERCSLRVSLLLLLLLLLCVCGCVCVRCLPGTMPKALRRAHLAADTGALIVCACLCCGGSRNAGPGIRMEDFMFSEKTDGARFFLMVCGATGVLLCAVWLFA